VRRAVVAAAVVVAVTGCGGKSATHDHKRLLECVRQTNSVTLDQRRDAVLVSFTYGKSVAALEHVAVGFGDDAIDAILAGRAPTTLGISGAVPDWTERDGDVIVAGFGPYEPRIGTARRLPAARAKAASRALRSEARSAISECLGSTKT